MAGRGETGSVTKKKDPTSMPSKKSLERLRQAGVPDDGNCLYCHNNNDDELKVGRLLKDRASGITIHHYCLLFASGLSQRGRGRQGIEGFLPDDIIQEFRRAKRLACRYCTNKGATIGCVVKRCPMTFHFHCGLANGSLSQFFGNFNSYCLEHRPHQETDLSCGSPSKIECPICFSDVPCETKLNVLKTPCCNNTWLHRECVQRQAISSGYFFRCPVCNNKKEFEVEMKMFGIYIPEQDASWEREDGAYQELLERHNECNADKCLCPDGRFFCKGKQWSIVLCDLCGSQGCHVKCGGLKNKSKDWACWICRTMVTSEVGSKKMKSTTLTKKQLNGRPYKMKLQGKPLRTPLPSNSLVKLFKDDDQPFSFSLSEGLPAARKAAGVHLPVVTMHPLTWQEIKEHGCSDQLLSFNLLRKSSRSCRLEIPPMIYKELDEMINKRKRASDSDEPPLITRMHKRPCLSLSPGTKDQHKPQKKMKLFQSKLFNVTEKSEVSDELNIKTCPSTSSLSDVFSQSEIFISSDEDNVDEDLLHKPVFPKDVELERQEDEIKSVHHQKLSETSEEDTSDSVKVFLCEKHKRTTADFIKSCKPVILNDVPVKLEHHKDKSISGSHQKLSEISDRETYVNINPSQSLCKKHKRTVDLVSSYNQTHNKTLPVEVEHPKDEGSFVGHQKQSKTSDDGISYDVNIPTSFCKKRQRDVDFEPILLHNGKLEDQNDKVMSLYHAKVTEASIDVNSMKNSVFCEKHKKKTSDLISSDEKVSPKNMTLKNSKDDKSCVSYQPSYVESEIQTDDYNSPVRRNTLKSFYADVSTDFLSMLEDEQCSEYIITKREKSTDEDENKKSVIRKSKKSKQVKRVKSQSNLVQPTLNNYFTSSESSSADELAPFEIRCSPRFKPPNRRITRASQRKQNDTFKSTECKKKKQKISNGLNRRRRRHNKKKKMEKTPTIDLHQYLIKCLPNSTLKKPSENDCTQVNLLNSQLLLSSSNRRLKEIKTSRSLRKYEMESYLKKKRKENKKEITKVNGERPTEDEKAQYSKKHETNMDEFTTIKKKRPPKERTAKYSKEIEENMGKSTKMKEKRPTEDETAKYLKEEDMRKSTKVEEERPTEDEKEQYSKRKEENREKSTKMKEKRPMKNKTAKYLKEKEESMGKSTKLEGEGSRKDERKKHVINITKYLKFTPNNDFKPAFNHSQPSSSRKHFSTCMAYKKCSCANEEGKTSPSVWSGTRDKLLKSVEVNSVSMKNKRTLYEKSPESTKSSNVIDLTQNVDNEITQKTPEKESRSHLNSCKLSSVKEKKPPSSRSKRNLSVTNFSSGDHNLTRLHSTPRSTPVQYLRRKLKMEDLCK